MADVNGTGHGVAPPGAGGGPTADRDALVRAAAWTFADHRPSLPTPEQVACFEAGFVRPVREWCEARADKVMTCYVASSRRKEVEVFVVRRRTGYDPALEDDMIGLQARLTEIGWGRVWVDSVFSDDPDEQAGVFKPGEALVVYGVRRSAPAEGRAEPAVPPRG